MKGFEKLLSPIEIAPNFVLKNRMIKVLSRRGAGTRTAPPTAAMPSPCTRTWRKGGVAAIDVAAILWEPAGGIYWALTTTGSFPA